ncbi:hypothetical protein HPP92_003843 [Vanilla planifolia]|uniref:Uncharacterized protein n=1 Tax=Vanilla planifolia TaxID=51239 RepID=A0A835VP12_VANPL|nr:hypothetical protein HPP92_003843 [Vanilla planifolia]
MASRRPLDPEEDHKLVKYIEQHGHGSWRALPKLAGLNRCGKSCRLRWTNYLRPDIKRGKFSHEEEQTILNLHSVLGNKWSAIATHLPGRTDNEIKNFWNTHLKKKLIQMGFDPMTHRPRTDFFAALPHLLALANIVDHRPAAAWLDGIGAEAAKLQCLQYMLLHSPAFNSVSTIATESINSMNLLSPPQLPFDPSSTSNLPVLSEPNAANQTVEFHPPLGDDRSLMNYDTCGFGLYGQGNVGVPHPVVESTAALPPLADMSNAADAESTSGCGGIAAASFWPDLLLDDPFLAEFA